MKPFGNQRRFGKGRARREPGAMNRTEARYAEQLEADRLAGKIVWWKFEAVKIRLARLTFLTVDFVVMNQDSEIEFHEIKGHMEDDAAVKLKVAADTFWPFRFVVVRWKNKQWQFEEVKVA